jgi:hypothetical protein
MLTLPRTAAPDPQPPFDPRVPLTAALEKHRMEVRVVVSAASTQHVAAIRTAADFASRECWLTRSFNRPSRRTTDLQSCREQPFELPTFKRRW